MGVAVLFTGCGPARSGLNGTVTYQGEAVADGAIRLDPLDGTKGAGGSAEIVNGAFTIPLDRGLYEGTYYVAISASRATGRRIKTEGIEGEPAEIDETVQYIPERYNAVSELRIKLAPGENTEDFALTP